MAESIRKASEAAKKDLTDIPIFKGTIPHSVVGRFGAARVLLRPASPGTGIIAGGAVRAVMESAGIANVLTKCLGSTNPHNVVKATMNGLRSLRKASEVARERGRTVADILGI